MVPGFPLGAWILKVQRELVIPCTDLLTYELWNYHRKEFWGLQRSFHNLKCILGLGVLKAFWRESDEVRAQIEDSNFLKHCCKVISLLMNTNYLYKMFPSLSIDADAVKSIFHALLDVKNWRHIQKRLSLPSQVLFSYYCPICSRHIHGYSWGFNIYIYSVYLMKSYVNSSSY